MWWGEKIARQPRSRACVDWCSNASRRISGLRPMSGSTWASRAHCGPEEHSVVVTLRWPVRSAAATTTTGSRLRARADRMRPPVSRAAFASVLMGPRALGASLVAARCASSSPVAAAAAAVTAYGEATTIRDSSVHVDRKACLSPPPHI
jgi:hypothetical protein